MMDEEKEDQYMNSTQMFSPEPEQEPLSSPQIPVSPDNDDTSGLFSTQRFSPNHNEPTLSQAVVGDQLDNSGDGQDLMMTQPFEASIAEADRIIESTLENLRRPEIDDSTEFSSQLLNSTQGFDIANNTQFDTNVNDDSIPSTQPFEAPSTQPFDDSNDNDLPPSPGVPASPEPEEETETLHSSTQPFDANESADFVHEEEGPKSPDMENEEDETPRSPEQEESGDEITSSPQKPRRVVLSDDEEETSATIEQEDTENKETTEEIETPASPASNASNKSAVDGLMADIFGGEESEGEKESGEEDVSATAAPAITAEESTVGDEYKEENEEEDEDSRRMRPLGFEWDFDVMLRRKKSENRKQRRKQKNVDDLLSDADEQIHELINRMKMAAQADRVANTDRKPALNKRKMLPFVIAQLRKADLLEALVDFGIMGAISEWLTPLPDRSLPALEIRNEMLKTLQQFPKLDQSILKPSGIGKAVMLLYKHPKETTDNRRKAGKLIADWARPIFQLDTDFRSLSRKDREERDYEHMPSAKKRRLSIEGAGGSRQDDDDEEGTLRPGDKGWIGRARVPQPSTKDYVVRPKSTVEGQFKGSSKKSDNSVDRKIREFKTKTAKSKKGQHAIPVNISGRQMSM